MSPFSRNGFLRTTSVRQCVCKHKRYQCLNIDLLASSLGSLVAHNQAVDVSTFVRHNSKLIWEVWWFSLRATWCFPDPFLNSILSNCWSNNIIRRFNITRVHSKNRKMNYIWGIFSRKYMCNAHNCSMEFLFIAESELRCVYKQVQAIHSRAARAWSWRLLRWHNDRSCWIRLWTKQNYINELKSWIFIFNDTRSLDTFKVVLEWTYLLSRFRCWRQCRS
jgi:hypothetical protein